MTTAVNSRVFRFSDVEVRERQHRIMRAGKPLAIEPKAVRVLLYLLENAGHVVTKEELLSAIWGDTAVTDNSLTRAVALIRRVLEDDPHMPAFIETVSTAGYRFICPVVVEDESSETPVTTDAGTSVNGGEAVLLAASPIVDTDAQTKVSGTKRRLWETAGVATIFLAFIAVAIWSLHRPLPLPRVAAYTQLTHDGHDKMLAGTDGSRIYFGQLSPNSIAQIAIAGGEIAQVPVAEQEHYRLYPRDVSPDGSSLLIAAEQKATFYGPLWKVDVLRGSVRRLAEGAHGAFSPDGNSIVYATVDNGIWLVRSDGTGTRNLAPAVRGASRLAWSPDARTIRFTWDNKLWEMSSDGSGLQQMLSDWHPSSRKCCGRWTPDGGFYVFLSREANQVGYQIWVLDERKRFLRRPSPEPVQLTSGPISWNLPVPGKDGKTIFAEGMQGRGELTRFDQHSKKLEPFLGGISAEFASFSRDGKSVAYVSFPDRILWKANRDGSNPVQLTAAPIYPVNPRWSPDGTQIVFTGTSHLYMAIGYAYIVPAEGGSPKRLLPEDDEPQTDPNWSPDGTRIVFCAGYFYDRKKVHLSILDLANRRVTPVPGSTGRWSPRWSPDGRYLATLSWERPELKLFDFKTETWSDLPLDGDVNYPEWSRDSQHLYSLLITSGGQGVFRNRVTGEKAEQIIDLKDWHFTGYGLYAVTLDPTDAPLFLRDIGSSDIYALALEFK